MRQPAACSALRRSDQQPRGQSLVDKQAVTQQQIADFGLHHQMQGQPTPLEIERSVLTAYAIDRRAVPELGQTGGGAQFRFLIHPVAADEPAAFCGEKPERGMAAAIKLAETLKGRLAAGE